MDKDEEEGGATALADGLADSFDELAGKKDKNAEADDDSTDETDDTEAEETADDAEEEGADDTADDDTKAEDDDTAADEDDESEEADDDTKAELDDEEEDDDDDLSSDFEDAAERHRLPTRFDDVLKLVPKEQRPAARKAFAARLGEMESGLNRAFAEARTERKELVKLRKVRQFEEANRVDFIADLIEKDAKLFDAINEELENRETPAFKKAKAMQRENAQKDLERSIDEEATAQDRQNTRADAIERLGRRTCREEGIPYELTEKALFIAITASNTDVLKRDLSDNAVKAIIKREAKIIRKATGTRRQSDAKEYVREKHRERKEGRRRVTGRDRGHAPAPSKRPEHKSLKAALTSAAARIVPDMPAG